MRRRDRSKQQAGSPLWMTTYADLITDLLVLFVLLYAFSELDVQRFQSVITSFQAYAGVLSGGLIQEGHRLLNDSSRDEIVRILEEFVRQRQLQTVVAVVPSAGRHNSQIPRSGAGRFGTGGVAAPRPGTVERFGWCLGADG